MKRAELVGHMRDLEVLHPKVALVLRHLLSNEENKAIDGKNAQHAAHIARQLRLSKARRDLGVDE